MYRVSIRQGERDNRKGNVTMDKVIKIVNQNGRPFNVRLVKKGDTYGRGNSLVHEEVDSLVEFYDGSQCPERFGEYGQFVARYYESTLKDRKRGVGLDLHGGVDGWEVSGDNMDDVIDWLNK